MTGSWFKRKHRATGYQSPLDPIVKAHDSGELTDEAYLEALMNLGDLRTHMYTSSGRCRHLGSYPGCRGGCNR